MVTGNMTSISLSQNGNLFRLCGKLLPYYVIEVTVQRQRFLRLFVETAM